MFRQRKHDAGEPRHLRPRHHAGGSDALDAQTLWIFAAVRPLHQPQECGDAGGRSDGLRGQLRLLPRGSQVDEEPDLPPRQPRRRRPEWGYLGSRRHQAHAGAAGTPANEFFSFTCNASTFKYLEDVGTFDITNPIETPRQRHRQHGVWGEWVQPPSLLSINYHAPYLHRGQAQTLEAVFPLHGLGPNGMLFPPTTRFDGAERAERADLLVFLKSIDGTTNHIRSAGDVFRDTLRLAGAPCPMP